MTTETTTPPTDSSVKAMITPNFLDILGEEHVVELNLDTNMMLRLFDENGDVISHVYVTAKTEHQARLELIDYLIKSARKLGTVQIGELAIKELSRRNNDTNTEETETTTGEKQAADNRV